MRILVTGATSFIASQIVATLNAVATNFFAVSGILKQHNIDLILLP